MKSYTVELIYGRSMHVRASDVVQKDEEYVFVNEGGHGIVDTFKTEIVKRIVCDGEDVRPKEERGSRQSQSREKRKRGRGGCPQCGGKMRPVESFVTLDEDLGGGRIVRTEKRLERMTCKKCGYVHMQGAARANGTSADAAPTSDRLKKGKPVTAASLAVKRCTTCNHHLVADRKTENTCPKCGGQLVDTQAGFRMGVRIVITLVITVLVLLGVMWLVR